jgi:hypothetical protein
MKLENFTKTLSRLKPVSEVCNWSESDVPLHHRGVSIDWLISFVNDLQEESLVPRIRALEERERVLGHNKAADFGMHNQPHMQIPQIPKLTFMNVHCFVEHFIKPLTHEIKAPLYARIPDEHIAPPDIFISHGWNSLLVGPKRQRIGTIDAMERGQFNPKASYIWIDFICYNQHLFETIAPDMERVIGEIGRVGFIATPVPLLNRSWCLWELLCCERTGASTDIFLRNGFRNDKILSVNAFFRSFTGIQASQTISDRDQTDIFEGFLKQFGTFDSADAYIEQLIREKLSAPWFELHEPTMDLQFRPYPWLYDHGSGDTGRAAGIEKWRTFDPYFEPSLKESVVLGSDMPVFDMLVAAGVQVTAKPNKPMTLRIFIRKTLSGLMKTGFSFISHYFRLLIFKAGKFKLYQLCKIAILKLFACFSTYGVAQVLKKYRNIESLEKSGEFEEARQVRLKALTTLKQKYKGPFHISEGQDRLYRLHDYKGAINSFEKAELTIDKSTNLFGRDISQPDSALSGIAIAAIILNDVDKAKIYCGKLVAFYNGLEKNKCSDDWLKHLSETLNWLNQEIIKKS